MTKLICLIGGSGSGKTTIAKDLENEGYNIIQSYTTRKERIPGEWGHTFIDLVKYEGVLKSDNIVIEDGESIRIVNSYTKSDMIAYFNSYKSDNHYFATDNQVVRGKTNIYIVDPLGAKQVHDYYKDSEVDVITIYLQVDEQIRAKRLLSRMSDKSFVAYFEEDATKCPEVWSRIRPDRKIFSIVESDYTINANGKIDKIIKLILKIIEEE